MLVSVLLSVVLVFSGRVTEERVGLAQYVRHISEGVYLQRTSTTAVYSGELDAPAITGTTYADVDAWVRANLTPGPVYLVTVPTAHKPIGTAGYQPYHSTAGGVVYALVPLPGLAGFWTSSVAHELAEIACGWECADPCDGDGPYSDGQWMYARYAGPDGECA